MTTDHRQQVLRLYHLALAREADDRDAFLAEACAGDKDLERDVRALFALDPPKDFLESPVIPEAERPFAGSPGLLIGHQVGAYRVHSRLGFGGMSEVYRAIDTTLGRQVAIKVLPALLAHDPERRGRFEREAKALAALNHPNIAQVYGMEPIGVGVSALVMELVAGETLAHLLKKGRLPIDVALRYGAQIADALAAAHTRGILHRDVKPANVMIGASCVKVLDFGLAKWSEATTDTAETVTVQRLTHPYEVLGTVAYMSPEQAEGKAVDARSDVFSLGIVLYEMLCGHLPFRGDTAIATLAARLNAEPIRPRAMRREIPAAVERIVLRCLEKKPERRYSSAAPVHRALVSSLQSRSVSLTRTHAALVTAACVMLVGAVAFGVWSYVGASRVQWVEREAVPEISRLITENQRLAALQLFQRAERYAPASRSLIPLTEGVKTVPVSIRTTPSGARIYISDYATTPSDDLTGWQFVGESPITDYALPRFGYYRLRALKDGFAEREETYTPLFMGLTTELTLHPPHDVPSGMVWVPQAAATDPAPSVALPGFWIDRYELTNRQFKEFVDAGGYERGEYWTQSFIRDGRKLPWREAVQEFRDATNRPGPAGWQLGTYYEGTGDLPVGGISWYEAMAYAEFAGKSLPTVYEWFAAAAIASGSDVMVGNFGGIGPTKVGGNSRMTRFGTFDMAGNVKEWAVNPSEQRRYLLGGAWNEDAYVFSVPDTRSPFARESTFGLRLVRRVAAVSEETLGPVVTMANRTVSLSAPVDERVFESFRALHAYDKTDLDARVERVDESSQQWRRETVTFRAAYGDERVIAHLFLPQESKPPYQVVILFGGSTIMQLRRVEDIEYPYQFLVRSGRAVLIPAYSGTLERGPSPLRPPVNQERERALKWAKDLGRSIDYLATRADVDVQRLALYAVSWGGAHAPRLLAVENRFKTGVLLSAGLLAAQPPETNAWNFAPRVRVPVLMLNGRDDFALPYETRQRPLFEALGSKEKVFRRYEGGHNNLVTRPDLIGEILDWLDKHLGPVVPRT